MNAQRILDEGRALEPTCALASSPAARSFKTGLRKLGAVAQVYHLALYCRADYVALVRCALAVGISANSVDISGLPLLCTAAAKGAERSLKALLEAGADVRLSERDGASALHFASCFGHAECVRLLLRAKAPVEAVSEDGTTPLMSAAYGGHRDVVEVLLSAGASLYARDKFGSQPLHHAAIGGDWPAVIHLLLKAGADANAPGYYNNTPLVFAIAQHHSLAVRELLPVTDFATVNRQGKSAWHVCASNGNDEILDLLLPYVTDLDAGTVAGGNHPDGTPDTVFNATALHLGCNFGQHTMVKKLLRLGASRTALNSANETPLSYAALNGFLSCTALLLGRPGAFRMTPAEVNLVSTTGWTALHYGAANGHLRVCGLLVQAGARLDATNADGKTPLKLAQQWHPANAPLHTLLAGIRLGPLPGTACERCAAVPDTALLHCSGCLSVRYCCPRCAAADWPRHAAYCKERREMREARKRPKDAAPPSAAGTA